MVTRHRAENLVGSMMMHVFCLHRFISLRDFLPVTYVGDED